jgi:hypothetical protein
LAVVVAVIAVFVLTRGDDKKQAVAVASSNSASASASQSASGSEPPVGPPAGFHLVDQAFTHGEVGVFAPDDWTDVQPVDLANGEPQLRVAPKVSQFIDGTFKHPGAQIDAFSVASDHIDPGNLEALLENFAHNPPESSGWFGGPPADACATSTRGNYPDELGIKNDGTFSGRFIRFDDCRGAGSLVFIVAVPADKRVIVTMTVQVVTPDDEQKLAVLAGSFNVFNLA